MMKQGIIRACVFVAILLSGPSDDERAYMNKGIIFQEDCPPDTDRYRITGTEINSILMEKMSSQSEAVYDSEYFDKSWKVLEQAINDIFNHNSTALNFEELYRSAYHMVLYRYGEKLYSSLVTTMTMHVKEVSKSIEATQEDMFLEDLDTKWADYNKALQMICDLVMYMDKTFIPATHKTHVHQLGINLWRDHIIRSITIQTRLLSTLLKFANREKIAEIPKKRLMRNVMQMLLETSPATIQEFYGSIDDDNLVAEITKQLQ